MKIKIWMCVIILSLTFALASCAKNELEEEWEPPKINETATAQAEKSQENEPEIVEDIKTADFLFMGYTSNGKPRNLSDINLVVDTINERLIKELGFEVNFEWVSYNNFAEDVVAKVMSDNCPDAIATWNRSDVFKELADNDMLTDITDLSRANIPNMYSIFEELLPETFDNLMYDDKLYLMPAFEILQIRNCVMVQKDIYDEYGKSFETIEEYGEFLSWVHSNYPEKIACFASPYDILRSYMTGNGYISGGSSFYTHIDDPKMEVKPMEQTYEFLQFLEINEEWSKQGYTCNVNETNIFDELQKGNIASAIYPLYNREYLLPCSNGLEYESIILYPKQTIIRGAALSGLIFPSDGDATDEAMRFIEWVSGSQENYDLLQYGVMDKNYSINNGKISFRYTGNNSIVGWWGSKSFSNFTLERPIWNEPEDYQAYYLSLTMDNTISYEQYYKKLGIDIKKAELAQETMEESIEEKQNSIHDMETIRNRAFEKLIDELYSQADTMTIEEIIAMLDEANGPELAQAYNELYELYYFSE